MKHISIASLLVLLLLSGCGVETPNETTQTLAPVEIVETTQATETTETTSPIETTVEVETTEVETTEEVKSNYLGKFKLTAYCPCKKCCGKWANGITSTGVTAKAGRTIAVDPKVIPYGTEVIINGHTYVAEDCGGSIKGNRIDIYFNTHSEAREFGVQRAEVYIARS